MNSEREWAIAGIHELTESDLDAVSGGGTFIASAAHTSMSQAAEALKAVAQK